VNAETKLGLRAQNSGFSRGAWCTAFPSRLRRCCGAPRQGNRRTTHTGPGFPLPSFASAACRPALWSCFRHPVCHAFRRLPPAAARHFALPTAWKSHAGLLTLLAAIAIWGCNWPVMKAGLNHVTPIWFSALRFATGGLCLFAIRLPAAPSSCPPGATGAAGQHRPAADDGVHRAGRHRHDAGACRPLGRAVHHAAVGPPIAVLVFGERLSRLQTTGLLLGLLGLVVRSIRPAMDWSDSAGVQANLMLMGASFLWGMTILPALLQG
jgi:hypothetical protein